MPFFLVRLVTKQGEPLPKDEPNFKFVCIAKDADEARILHPNYGEDEWAMTNTIKATEILDGGPPRIILAKIEV
jgi:hypothetical protein